MKKIKYVSFILSILLLCNSCSFLQQLICDHQYNVISEEASTCSSNGKVVKECELCHKVKVESIDKLPHNFNSDFVSPNCSEQGYKHNVCLNCGYEEKTDYVNALGHKYGEFVVILNPSDVSDGIKERVCEVCNHVDRQYIISKSYVDLSVIKEEFDPSINYQCNSYDELLAKFNAAVLYMSNTLNVTLTYEEKDFKSLLSRLLDDCSVPFSLSVEASLKVSELTFNIKYNDYASKTTSSTKYSQYDSFNATKFVKTRSDDFEDFKINSSSLSYEVFSSEQLYYVLERGVKPICKKDSQAEKIYNLAKYVLRNIISDDMRDVEKVKAINDYLVMNVVYDGVLLDMAYQDSSKLVKYNGFYLEGVFIDNKAVCEGICKAFTVLCNIEGIPCVSINGYSVSNPNGIGHAWNKVYVDDKWYIADATSSGTIVNNSFEVLTYSYLLTSEEYFSSHYVGENYKELKCEDIYDVYSLTTYEYKGITYDLNIDSKDELKAMLYNFFKENKSKTTVEFYVNFDFGSTVTDEISSALTSLGLYANFSYIDNKEYFMIVK